MKFEEALSNYSKDELKHNKCNHKWNKIKVDGREIEYCDKCDSSREIKKKK